MHTLGRRTARAGRHGKAPRRYPAITAEQFRDARVFGGLTREQAAQALGVSLRTIGHWETGRARPAWAAFKLLRVIRHGELPDPAWSGYRLIRGALVTPEGHSFLPHEAAWLSLLVRRARAFSDLQKQVEDMGARAAQRPRVLGLSLSPTKEKYSPVAPAAMPPISRVGDTLPGEGDAPLGQAGVPIFPVSTMAATGGHPRILGGAL